MQGDERLVRGDHVLALPDGPQHEVPRGIGAADELDDHVDAGIVDHQAGVAGEVDSFEVAVPRMGGVAHRGPRHLDAPPRTARDLARVAPQHVDGAGPDRAEPEHPDAYRFQWLSFQRQATGANYRSDAGRKPPLRARAGRIQTPTMPAPSAARTAAPRNAASPP